MEPKNVLIGLVAGLALILGIYAAVIKQPSVTIITKSDGSTEVVKYGGADSSFPCESHNGVTTCTDKKEFNNGSTTLASFKSPTATSSLRIGAGSMTTASTSALQFEWGRSELVNSTSTSLGRYNLAASVKAMILASTSPSTAVLAHVADGPYIIPPNTFVNLKYGGDSCDAPTGGDCNSLEGSAIVEFTY